MKTILLWLLSFGVTDAHLAGFNCSGSITYSSFNYESKYHLSLMFGENGKGYYQLTRMLPPNVGVFDERNGFFSYYQSSEPEIINMTLDHDSEGCDSSHESDIPFDKCADVLMRGMWINNSIRLVGHRGTVMICTPPP